MYTVREIGSRAKLRLNLLIQGCLIGILVGFVITAYRQGIEWVSHGLRQWLMQIHAAYLVGAVIPVIAFVIVMLFLGLGAAFCYRLAPFISGSGIPQVSAQLAGRLKPRWQRILPLKFIGGLLTLGGGLTLGREGPSVQIGAAVGQGFADVFKRPFTERRYLITGGASAGLAAAFNAPISGAVFALEEMHRNFSPRALICAMMAAFSAVITSGLLLGAKPVLHFENVAHLPLKYYYLVLGIGILTGFSGILFSKGIIFFKKCFARFQFKWPWLGILPFFVVAIVSIINPELFGSGEQMIHYPAQQNGRTLLVLIGLYFLKLFLLLFCFGSGLPGGIFFPMLVLGALVGHISGLALYHMGWIEPQYVLVLSLMAMAGHFSAIVRAPMTGILLVSEMTGSFSYMLPLGVVALVSYIVATLFKVPPIYESLEGLLQTTEPEEPEHDMTPTEARMIMEFVVEDHAYVDGKCIADVQWPEHFMIVAVRRGSGEITPTGRVCLRAGDYLVGLFRRFDLAMVQSALKDLTVCDWEHPERDG